MWEDIRKGNNLIVYGKEEEESETVDTLVKTIKRYSTSEIRNYGYDQYFKIRKEAIDIYFINTTLQVKEN